MAVRVFNESGVCAKALIVGDVRLVEKGDDRKVVAALDEAVRRGEAEFAGLLTHHELARFYRSAHVGVVPSTFEEPFGLVACEMGACGLPVIASRSGGLPEVVVDGDTGLVVPRRDVKTLSSALRLLIEDRELRLRFGASARRRMVSRFAWDLHVRRVLDVYAEDSRRAQT